MAGVVIDGLDAALARLDALPARARREVDLAVQQVTAANAAQIRAGAGAAGRRAAAAARSVRADGDSISGGGPFFMGSVFGGRGRPTTQHFAPYVGGNGYWFFTTLSASFSDTLERFDAVVDAVVDEWGS